MDNLKYLQELGLSDKEVKIYTALFSLGPSPASLVAKEAGIKRPSTYFALSRLSEKGLISKTIADKREVFQAESPEILVRLAKQQTEQSKNLEEIVLHLIPNLKTLQSNKSQTLKIRTLEGIEGLWDVAEDTLREKKDIYVLGSLEKLQGIYSKKSINNYGRRRQRLGIKAYVLSDQNLASIEEYLEGEFKFIEYRFLPKSIKLDSYFVFYGSKTFLATGKDAITGIVIEDEAITASMKLMFWALWEKSKGEKLAFNA